MKGQNKVARPAKTLLAWLQCSCDILAGMLPGFLTPVFILFGLMAITGTILLNSGYQPIPQQLSLESCAGSRLKESNRISKASPASNIDSERKDSAPVFDDTKPFLDVSLDLIRITSDPLSVFFFAGTIVEAESLAATITDEAQTTALSNSNSRDHNRQAPIPSAPLISSEPLHRTSSQTLRTDVATGDNGLSGQPHQSGVPASSVPSPNPTTANPPTPNALRTGPADGPEETDAWPTHHQQMQQAPPLISAPSTTPNTSPPPPQPNLPNTSNQSPYRPEFQDSNACPAVLRYTQEAQPWGSEHPVTPDRQDAINEAIRNYDALFP